MVLCLCWDTGVKQTSSYQREVFCSPQGVWLLAPFQSLHKSTLTQLLLKNKVLIFQYRDWQCYFKFRFILPLFLFTSNLPRGFSVETCQETSRLSSGSHTKATEHAQCESFKDNKTYGSQLWGLTVINQVDHPVSTFFSNTNSQQAGKAQNSTNNTETQRRTQKLEEASGDRQLQYQGLIELSDFNRELN